MTNQEMLVSSIYINRYNALFSTTYRYAETMIRRLMETVLTVTCTNFYIAIKGLSKDYSGEEAAGFKLH